MNYDDLDTYNGDTEHDMWIDFDNYEPRRARGTINLKSPRNTGTPDVFDVPDLDEYIDTLNDWD